MKSAKMPMTPVIDFTVDRKLEFTDPGQAAWQIFEGLGMEPSPSDVSGTIGVISVKTLQCGCFKIVGQLVET
jgi:hypothetical protein